MIFGSVSDFGAFLQGVGAILGPLAVCFAAWCASSTFDSWRKQRVTELRMQHAERILEAVYKARRSLEMIRSGAMLAGEINESRAELEKLPIWREVAVGSQESIVKAHTYSGRVSSSREEQIALISCLPMAKAHFGNEVADALERLDQQFLLINTAIGVLATRGLEDELYKHLEGYLMKDKKDEAAEKMSREIEHVVKTVEDNCLPEIRTY